MPRGSGPRAHFHTCMKACASHELEPDSGASARVRVEASGAGGAYRWDDGAGDDPVILSERVEESPEGWLGVHVYSTLPASGDPSTHSSDSFAPKEQTPPVFPALLVVNRSGDGLVQALKDLPTEC